MNILKRYTFRVEHFSLSDMSKILTSSHPTYDLERRAVNMYFIHSKVSNEMRNLRCIHRYYTVHEDGKPTKIPKNSGECFNCKKAFGLDTNNTCVECHQEMLNKFSVGKSNLIRK